MVRAALHRPSRGTVSVTVVLVLAGVLFATNAVTAASTPRHADDLAGLARTQADRVAALSADVDSLRAEVDALTAEQAQVAGLPTPGGAELVASGASAVTGPGLVVSLDDAPSDSPLRDGISPDVLVVHQQDLQAVMNALWAGGAEAMMLMDQRVISTSAFRCVGNVLRLHGLLFSPPYTVTAIGDPDDLRSALDASPAIQAYRRDARDVGLGWDVTEQEGLELPAFSGATDLRWARLPAGVDPFAGWNVSAP